MENINQYIIYGNFTKKHTGSLLKITDMYMTKYIKFELMFVYLDENRLFLIDKLKSLPEKEWVVCSTIVKSGVLQLQLGIPNQKVLGLDIFSSFNSMTGSPIFYGKLEKMLRSTLFIKDSEDIGIAYISPTLLIKKLEKAVSAVHKGRSVVVAPNSLRKKHRHRFSPTDLDELEIGDLLKRDVISEKLYSNLSLEDKHRLRGTAKDVKSTVDRNTETIIKFNPKQIKYESLPDIESVCNRFGKKPNECTFEVEFNMENDTEENKFFTPSIEALKSSGVKLIAKFSLSGVLNETTEEETKEKAYKLLFETIAILPNIVSLDIVFGEQDAKLETQFLNDSFTTCDVTNVLSKLTNLSVLRIFNVKIAWNPLFDCLKNLKLDEFVLSKVELVTDDTTEYDQDRFLEKFVEAVPNIRTFGLHYQCYIDEKHAIDIFLIALSSLPRLSSLDFSENDLYDDPSFFRDIFTPRMQNLKQIKELNISRNCFDEGAIDLSALLVELPNLEVLKMSETKLNKETLDILTPSLSKLKMLDISKNYDLDEEEDVVTLQNNLPKVKVIYDL